MNPFSWLKSLFFPPPRGDIAKDDARHDVIATGDDHLDGADGDHHGGNSQDAGDHGHGDGGDGWGDDGGSE